MHPLADDYLRRLRRAARPLPRSDRRELYAEIESHLAEATSSESKDSEVLNVLDRLGDPAEIVDAQRPQLQASGAGHPRERWAIALLLLGGFALGLGWLVGVVLLWTSRLWTTREKWIGTLIIPGGLAVVPLALAETVSTESCKSQGFFGPSQCTGSPTTGAVILDVLILIAVMGAPLCTARYLARRLR